MRGAIISLKEKRSFISAYGLPDKYAFMQLIIEAIFTCISTDHCVPRSALTPIKFTGFFPIEYAQIICTYSLAIDSKNEQENRGSFLAFPAIISVLR